MKQIVRFLSVLCFLLLINSNLFAYVGYDCKVDGIYYKRISTDEFEVAPKEVKDEWGSRGSENNADAYTGNVTIPSSVTYNGKTFQVTGIGNNAFFACSMTSVTIPSSIKTIGKIAFGCQSLSSFNYLGDLSEWCKIKFADERRSNPINITHHLFIKGKEIQDLVIPEDVNCISTYAFIGCQGITSVTIPNHVTSIEDFSFEGCSNIKSVYLSNKLSSIGNFVFYDCTSLTSITIPNGVTRIGSGAFSGCTSLTSIKLPSSLTYIENHAFRNCTSLKSINIPSGCSLGSGAFQGCTSLKSIDIPRTYEIYPDMCKDCTSLETVVIRGCSRIGFSAFSGATALSSIYIYSTEPPFIQPSTFDDNHFVWTDLYVPKGTKGNYKQWKFVSIIEFDATGIDVVNDDEVHESVRYNLEGHKIAEPERGVNIFKMNDGTTRKFVVK